MYAIRSYYAPGWAGRDARFALGRISRVCPIGAGNDLAVFPPGAAERPSEPVVFLEVPPGIVYHGHRILPDSRIGVLGGGKRGEKA